MDYNISSFFDEEQKCWLVDISGEVDIFKSQEFRAYLLLLMDKNRSDIRMDCAGLEYIDSTALGALVSVLKRVREYGGEISLSNVKSNIRKLFRITGLDRVLSVEGDDADD